MSGPGRYAHTRIANGGGWFCYPGYIDGEMRRIFTGLMAGKFLAGIDRETVATRAAPYLAESMRFIPTAKAMTARSSPFWTR